MGPIKAKGSFHEVGRVLGAATAEDIRFQERYLVPDILKDAFGGDELAMRRAARAQHEATAEFWPAAYELFDGMAKGAGMRPDVLMPVTYCEEIAVGPSTDAMREKCSTLLVRTPSGWGLGHEEDYVRSFYGRLHVFDLEFDGHPRMVSLNYPGNYPGVAGSLNAAGVAIVNNSLWPEAQRGIPKQVKHFRATLEAEAVGAIGWLVYPPHVLTDHFTVVGGAEDVALSLEVTSHPSAPQDCEIREIVHDDRPDEEGIVRAPFWHANHVRWLEPWASGIVKDPANRSSAMRARALRDICAEGAPGTLEELTRRLIRKDGVLNRDASLDLTGSSTVTLATTVIDPSARRIRFYRYGGKGTRKDEIAL